MIIPTVTSLKRARARADRDRHGAAKMQGGATLHLHFEKSEPTWSLSDGTKVNSETAKIVTSNLNVVGVGDCLPLAPSVSQTFRWLD
jgi:hypothetical protein